MATPAVRSVRRAFEILEIFARLRRPLTLKELALEIDCPLSTVSDLLKTLSNVGCLSFDSVSKSYFPTMQLASLGEWVRQELLPGVNPYEALGRLQNETGGTVLLGTPNDLEIQYQIILEGPQSARYSVKPNGRRPLVSSGAGWLVLSRLDDDQIERIWRRSIASGFVKRDQQAFVRLRENVQFCRRNGYAIARDSINPGAALVAMALPPRDDGRLHVVALGGRVERIEADAPEMAAKLRASVAGCFL